MAGHWQNRIRASFCRLPQRFCSLHEPEDTSVGPFCFCPCPSLPSTDPRVCPVHCEINVSVLHSACHLRHVLLCSRATALGNSKTQANSCFQIRNRSILWAEIQKNSLICEAVLKIVNGMIVLNTHMDTLKGYFFCFFFLSIFLYFFIVYFLLLLNVSIILDDFLYEWNHSFLLYWILFVNVIGMHFNVFDSFMEVFKAHVSWIRCYYVHKIYASKILALEKKMQKEKYTSVWLSDILQAI